MSAPRHLGFSLLLCVYLALGITYVVVVPAFEAPDEPAHFRYVLYLIAHRRFPVQQAEGSLSPTLEAHQPPLYYLAGAACSAWVDLAGYQLSPANPCVQWSPDLSGQRYVYLHGAGERFPYQGGWLALHLVRGLSVLLGGGTLCTVYALAGRVWPTRTGLRLLPVSALALNPQFVFMHASVNNDNLATLLSSLLLLVAVRALSSRRRWQLAVLSGLLLGFGALTKYSVAALAPVAVAGALAPSLRERRWKEGVLCLGLLLLVPVLIAGWWYARNYHVYGDLLAWRVALASHPHDVRTAPLDWPALRTFVTRVFASFWGYFGWLTVRLSTLYYGAFAVVTGGSLLGLSLALRSPRQVPGAVWMALLAPISVGGALLRYITTYNHTAYQGRLLFPAAAAIALLLAYGWSRLLARRAPWVLLSVALAGGLAANAFSLRAILDAYPRPEVYETIRFDGLASSCIVLDERLQLLAYAFAPQPARSGKSMDLVLHWYGLSAVAPDGQVVVRVLGRDGAPVDQRAFAPRVVLERITQDRLALQVSATDRPMIDQVTLAYVGGDGRAVPLVTRNRYPAGEEVALGPVKVIPQTAPRYSPEHGVDVRLGDAIRLVGYTLSPTQIAPGEVLQVVLYWAADASVGEDYSVFVHLLGKEGVPIAQGDGRPDRGSYPTIYWEAGEQIVDIHSLPVPAGVTEGVYALGVGLYLPQTLQRLPAYDARGTRLPSDVAVLGPLDVRGPMGEE
jgi:4-amino-4-deoxy-L-arabinose transferase-like glycosyltransferase